MASDRSPRLEAWWSYLQSLEEDGLRVAAKAMNSAGFMGTLQEQGFSQPQVQTVMGMLAHRLTDKGVASLPPGHMDLASLAQQPRWSTGKQSR